MSMSIKLHASDPNLISSNSLIKLSLLYYLRPCPTWTYYIPMCNWLYPSLPINITYYCYWYGANWLYYRLSKSTSLLPPSFPTINTSPIPPLYFYSLLYFDFIYLLCFLFYLLLFYIIFLLFLTFFLLLL